MSNSSKTFGKLTIPLLLLLAICFSVLPAQAKYGGGTGEPNDPYLIYTSAQMNAIGADSNDWDKHFKLMADIDLSGFDGQNGRPVFNMIAPDKDSSTWQFDGVPFTGVFDGNSHTISNFSYTSTGTNYLGLFGHINGPSAEIKNLGLIEPNVDAGTGNYVGSLVGLIWEGTVAACYAEGGSASGSDNVGGLVGKNGRWSGTEGIITDCYSTTSVSGNWYVGGLVGMNYGIITNCCSSGSVAGDWLVGGLVGDNLELITNSYSTASVSGNSGVGGLAGESWGTTTNCCSTGSVTGGNSVGGLVGSNYHGTITNCYSTASVLGDECIGGLVGYNYGTITNCYSTGTVSGNRHVGGLVGHDYYGTITNCYATGSVSGTTDVGGLVGYSGDWSHSYDSFWDTETSGQTTSGSGTGLPTAEMQTQSTFTDAGWDFIGETANGTEDIWKICEGEDYPKLSWEKYGGGTGESNNPYLIYTSCQMNAIGADPNDWDKHFMLMTDIDLSGYIGPGLWSPPPPPPPQQLLVDVALSTYTEITFNIIGRERFPFTGVFEGNGHTISNFISRSPDTDNIGLFGYIDGPSAEISNLGLIDPNVDAGTGRDIGSLVGINGGNITNCYVAGGSVSGNENVGGLVGGNGGEISNCYSTASVSGGEAVGGLVGLNYAKITTTYSITTVFGNTYVGGLVGLNCGTITNSYSQGIVSGDDHVGGLVGENGFSGPPPPSSVYTISNCYLTGSVEGNAAVGGLMGVNDEGTITNCCSTAGVSGNKYVGGLVGSNAWQITITNCYSTGSVSGYSAVGGLVGYNWGTITNCYAAGSVTGDEGLGGLVAYNYKGTVSASFWDIETSGQANSDGGTGLPTAEMQMQLNFMDAGWDFITPVWTIEDGVDYPRLWWEFVPVLHAEPEVTLGTSNIISWDPVIGAVEYYAECGEDASLTSIVYNSGWIIENSCEFTGLQLGKRYWYSVKARNAAGTETGWSNVESSLQCTLADAVEIELTPESLKSKNLKKPLINKINIALEMIDEGNYTSALSKLQNDILAKMDGCVERGEPDKNDWIITCKGQNQIYPLVIETIEYVRGLME